MFAKVLNDQKQLRGEKVSFFKGDRNAVSTD